VHVVALGVVEEAQELCRRKDIKRPRLRARALEIHFPIAGDQHDSSTLQLFAPSSQANLAVVPLTLSIANHLVVGIPLPMSAKQRIDSDALTCGIHEFVAGVRR